MRRHRCREEKGSGTVAGTAQRVLRTTVPDPFSSRGFSLFELVLTIVIMLIMARIAVPRFANAISNQRVNAAARRIAADLSRAQKLAKSASTSQTVTFTTSTSQYTITGLTDLDRSTASYVVKLSDSPYRVSLGATNLGNDTNLVFDGYGVPDSGGSIVVQVGNYTKTVTVAAGTGEVAIQ